MKRRIPGFFAKSWKTVAMYLCAVLLMQVGLAQQVTITGRVTNATGDVLSGATVFVKDGTAQTLSDQNGSFTITAPANSTIGASFVGYETQFISLTDNANINFVLVESAQDLGGVVVVGYGTQLKKDLTGAVSTIDVDNVSKIKATTVAGALQGLATGITVRGGSRPGSEESIQIRGIKNLSGTNPLYVVDGLPTYANRDFNPNDIESIQILKDASAAAIYGSRAANGVIIITTKRGKEGPLKVNGSATYSIQTIPRYKLAGTEEFTRLNYMAYDNAGKEHQQLETGNNTDWQDIAFRQGHMRDYNASLSGGGKNGSFYLSGGYMGHVGTVIGTGFDRYTLRINTSGTKGRFSFGEFLAISNSKADEMAGNPILDVVRLLPTIPVYNADNPGGYGYGDEAKARTFGTNPLAISNLIDETNENLRLRGNIWGEIRILNPLRYKLNVGYENSSDHHFYQRKPGNWTLNQPIEVAPILNENRASFYKKLIENTLSFKKDFGDHALGLIAGQSYEYNKYQQIWGTRREQPQNSTGGYFSVLDLGTFPELGGYAWETALLSYFGRFEYNYADRYLLNGVFRRDGSSVLNRNMQWGNFPSISAAWRVSNEEFFNFPAIDDLKLRANYGTLGSSNISSYSTLALINTLSTITMGTGQLPQPTGTQRALVNSNLTWETLEMQNYGFDLSMLDKRLGFSAEYYIANTDNVLTRPPISLTTGHDGDAPLVNAISMQNKGFEFSADYTENRNILNYRIGANLTTNSVFIKDLAYGRSAIYGFNQIFENNAQVGQWYVLKSDGIFQTQQEIDGYKSTSGTTIQPDAKPGDLRFIDTNGDGQITVDDRQIVGNSWAKFELGVNAGLIYKDFELTMNWFGAFGHLVYNGPRSVTDRFDDNSNYMAGIQPWTPENKSTTTPRALYASTMNARGDIDRWLEDGSFFRLKTIDLTYAIPSTLINKIGFDNARISLTGQNLLTFTKYTGLDPEFQNISIFSRGHDYGIYPNAKTYTIGIHFGF